MVGRQSSSSTAVESSPKKSPSKKHGPAGAAVVLMKKTFVNKEVQTDHTDLELITGGNNNKQNLTIFFAIY